MGPLILDENSMFECKRDGRWGEVKKISKMIEEVGFVRVIKKKKKKETMD